MKRVTPIKLNVSEIDLPDRVDGFESYADQAGQSADNDASAGRSALSRSAIKLAAPIVLVSGFLFLASQTWDIGGYASMAVRADGTMFSDRAGPDAQQAQGVLNCAEDGSARPGATSEEFVRKESVDGRTYLALAAVSKNVGGEDCLQGALKKAAAAGRKNAYGAIATIGEASYVSMNPVSASLGADESETKISISLVFETDDVTAELLLDHGRAVNEALASILTSMDQASLHELTAPEQISEQLLEKITALLPEAAIEDILVEEFVIL